LLFKIELQGDFSPWIPLGSLTTKSALNVFSAAARMVRGSGPDSPQPGRMSGAFPVSHRTVHDGAGSSSALLKSRSCPLGRDLRVCRVDRSLKASPDDVESPRT
jgi:hypothetical protein